MPLPSTEKGKITTTEHESSWSQWQGCPNRESDSNRRSDSHSVSQAFPQLQCKMCLEVCDVIKINLCSFSPYGYILSQIGLCEIHFLMDLYLPKCID